MDKYEIDKYYYSLYGKWYLDKKAIEAAGIELPTSTPNMVERPDGAIPKTEETPAIPELSSVHTLSDKKWNYVTLINAFEKVNTRRVSRADVKAALKLKKITIAKTITTTHKEAKRITTENLLNILVREVPNNEAQKFLKSYFCNNPEDLLLYLGIDVKLLKALEQIKVTTIQQEKTIHEVDIEMHLLGHTDAITLTNILVNKGETYTKIIHTSN
jgi:hypothetical protein